MNNSDDLAPLAVLAAVCAALAALAGQGADCFLWLCEAASVDLGS